MTDPAQPRHTERVRVTSSRRGATTVRRRSTARELAEQTGIGELYLQGLLRAQLRLALGVLGIAGATLLGLPLLFALVPATRSLEVAGLPLPWVVLGVLLYPAMVGIAAWFDQHAGRLERRFAEAMDQEG